MSSLQHQIAFFFPVDNRRILFHAGQFLSSCQTFSLLVDMSDNVYSTLLDISRSLSDMSSVSGIFCDDCFYRHCPVIRDKPHKVNNYGWLLRFGGIKCLLMSSPFKFIPCFIIIIATYMLQTFIRLMMISHITDLKPKLNRLIDLPGCHTLPII